MCSLKSVDELLAVDPGSLTGAELSELVLALDAARSRLEAAQLAAVGEWDARGEWGVDGARSGVSWLAQRCDMRRGTALRMCRDARLLRDQPVSASACRSHGTAKVRTMLGFVNERTRDEFARQEAFLLGEAERLTVDETAVMMRFWALHADPSGADPADPTRNELNLSKMLDGRWDLRGNLDAVLGAGLQRALETRADRLYRAYRQADDGVARSRSRLLAEALALLVRNASVGDTDGGVPAQPSMTVVVDYDFLVDQLHTRPDQQNNLFQKNCHIGGTDPVRGETARRLACDAGINRMIVKGGSIILDAGRTVRTVTPQQRRAMRARSPGCEFGLCDLPERWCSSHHIQWWGRDSGDTNIGDLAFLCPSHHHLVHEGGWTMARLATGDIEIHRPDGTLFKEGRTAA